MKNLVKRYVAAMIRDAKKEEGLTEENFKELKQDISSFRFEVLGLLKGNKLNLNNTKMSNSSDNSEAEEKSRPKEKKSRTQKNRISFFDITTMIHPRTAEITAEKHNISNGSATLASETAKEKPKKIQFSKDIKSFGLFHRRPKSSSMEQSSNKIYSVSEEVPEELISNPSEKTLDTVKDLEPNCELNVNTLNEQCTVTEDTRDTLVCLPLQPSDSFVNDSPTDNVEPTIDKDVISETSSTQAEKPAEEEDSITRL